MCPEYAVGPGHHTHSRSVVIEAYAETGALDVFCPACHAQVDDFCRHKSGVDRKMPCPKRLVAARIAVQESRAALEPSTEGVSDA